MVPVILGLTAAMMIIITTALYQIENIGQNTIIINFFSSDLRMYRHFYQFCLKGSLNVNLSKRFN